MKNKKLLYILIPAVIGVWGAIIYKVVVGMGGNEDNSIQKIEMAEIHSTEVFNDTFSINPTYRDPFSGKQVKKIVFSSGQQTVKKVVAQPVIANWPSITYGGIVKNQKSNKQLVLVSINGQSTMLKIGESYSNVELLKVFKDSIEVKFGKEKKFIKK